jgi:hypothetical protein
LDWWKIRKITLFVTGNRALTKGLYGYLLICPEQRRKLKFEETKTLTLRTWARNTPEEMGGRLGSEYA